MFLNTQSIKNQDLNVGTGKKRINGGEGYLIISEEEVSDRVDSKGTNKYDQLMHWEGRGEYRGKGSHYFIAEGVFL